MGHVSVVTEWLLRFGSEPQQAEWLPRLVSGEMLATWALDESGAGDDLDRIALRAEPDARGFVLSGRKTAVLSGMHAGVFLVVASTGQDPRGRPVLRAFLVNRDTPGLGVVPSPERLGLRGAGWAELELQACRVDAGAALGASGTFRSALATVLSTAGAGIAAIALGIGSVALDAAARYARERVAFGKTLSKQQAVAGKLADMTLRWTAARHLTYDAGRHLDLERDVHSISRLAKVAATEAATHCADEAIQIHGGYGFTREYHVERHYRDALVCEVLGGRNEFLKLAVARQLLEA
jgi:alkylation response protein AidB-like acyl-CoA dehydrogenase